MMTENPTSEKVIGKIGNGMIPVAFGADVMECGNFGCEKP